jgi:hypothetical protein
MRTLTVSNAIANAGRSSGLAERRFAADFPAALFPWRRKDGA